MFLNGCFEIKEIDKVAIDPKNPSVKVTNKIFSKVSRILAKSDSNKIEVIFDVNSDLFVSKEGDKIELLITDSPFTSPTDTTTNSGIFDLENLTELDFIKNYEYVMHGTIFHSGLEGNEIFIYASFGGLLMKYYGFVKEVTMEDIKLDKKILLMIKKKSGDLNKK